MCDCSCAGVPVDQENDVTGGGVLAPDDVKAAGGADGPTTPHHRHLPLSHIYAPAP